MAIPMDFPAALLQAIIDGRAIRYGCLIKDVATGRILGHLKEVGGLSETLARIPIGPLTSVLQMGQWIDTHGQLQKIRQTLDHLQLVSTVGTVASVVGLGVSVAGFALVLRRLNRLEFGLNAAMGKLRAEFERLHLKFDLLQTAELHSASATHAETAIKRSRPEWTITAKMVKSLTATDSELVNEDNASRPASKRQADTPTATVATDLEHDPRLRPGDIPRPMDHPAVTLLTNRQRELSVELANAERELADLDRRAQVSRNEPDPRAEALARGESAVESGLAERIVELRRMIPLLKQAVGIVEADRTMKLDMARRQYNRWVRPNTFMPAAKKLTAKLLDFIPAVTEFRTLIESICNSGLDVGGHSLFATDLPLDSRHNVQFLRELVGGEFASAEEIEAKLGNVFDGYARDRIAKR